MCVFPGIHHTHTYNHNHTHTHNPAHINHTQKHTDTCTTISTQRKKRLGSSINELIYVGSVLV